MISSKLCSGPLEWCLGRETEDVRRLRVPEDMDAFLVFEDEKYDHMPGRSMLLDIAWEEIPACTTIMFGDTSWTAAFEERRLVG